MAIKVILGIDTARGWAITKHEGSFRVVLEAGTVKGLPEMLKKIRELWEEYHGKIDLVRIEKPASTWIKQRPGQSELSVRRRAVNVGQNIAKADAIFEFCQAIGIPAMLRPPIRGYTKLSAELVYKITGYQGKSSEHARDAILISWV